MIRPTIPLDWVTSKGVRVLAEVAEQAPDDLRARDRVARVADVQQPTVEAVAANMPG
jgi:hypothetical protein